MLMYFTSTAHSRVSYEISQNPLLLQFSDYRLENSLRNNLLYDIMLSKFTFYMDGVQVVRTANGQEMVYKRNGKCAIICLYSSLYNLSVQK